MLALSVLVLIALLADLAGAHALGPLGGRNWDWTNRLAVVVTIASLAVSLVIWRWTKRTSAATDDLISEISQIASNAHAAASGANEAASSAASVARSAERAADAAREAAEDAGLAADLAFEAAEAGRVASENTNERVARLQEGLFAAATNAPERGMRDNSFWAAPEPEDLSLPPEGALGPSAVDLPDDEGVQLFDKEKLPLRVIAALVRDWERAGSTGRYELSSIGVCGRSLTPGARPWYVHFPKHDTWSRITFDGDSVDDSVVEELSGTEAAGVA